MATFLRWQISMLASWSSILLALGLLTTSYIWTSPAPPPKPGIPDRLAEVKRKLEVARGINITATRALEYGHRFLDSANRAQEAGRFFQADRLIDAADAMVHVAEHQEHLRSGGGPAGPPPDHSLVDHLDYVYFRVQQADYFLKESADSRVAAFPKWARDFYQLAMRAYERKDPVAADENAKSAEEVVKCLEDLAQAANMASPPPPEGPHGEA